MPYRSGIRGHRDLVSYRRRHAFVPPGRTGPFETPDQVEGRLIAPRSLTVSGVEKRGYLLTNNSTRPEEAPLRRLEGSWPKAKTSQGLEFTSTAMRARERRIRLSGFLPLIQVTRIRRNASRIAAGMLRLATASPIRCNSNPSPGFGWTWPDISASRSVTPSLPALARRSR